MSPEGKVLKHWNQIPLSIRQQFRIGEIESNRKYRLHHIVSASLLYDNVLFPDTRLLETEKRSQNRLNNDPSQNPQIQQRPPLPPVKNRNPSPKTFPQDEEGE